MASTGFKKVHMVLRTPYMDLDVRDFELDFSGTDMPATLLTSDAKTLIDGEWMTLTATGKMTRAQEANTSPFVGPAWPYYAERGRTDTAAINKIPVIWRGSFEADTHAYDGTDVSNMVVGNRLIVAGNSEFGGNATDQLSAATHHSVLKFQSLTATVAKADGVQVGWCIGGQNASTGMIRVYCSVGGSL